ncbi:MAG: hypothetical protein NZM04_08315, partial [Methylacidiphilales bacterium]|nr:hypothetical protein [Candidatus Methylacidiphilales bacterium]
YQRLHQKTGILPQIPCHLYAVIYYPPWVSMNSALYRRSIHKQLGLWPTDALSFADCLFARDYFVHYQAYYEPSTQAFWRQHPQQASQSQPSNKNKQNLYVLKLFDHIKKLSYIPTYKKELSADLISLLTQLYYLFAINRNGKKTSLKIKLAFYIDIIRKVLSEKLPASILHSSRIPAHLIQTLIETTFTELLSEKKDFTTLLSQSIYEFKNRKIKLHYHHKLPHLTTLPAQLCPRQNNFPSFTTVLFYHDNPSTNNTVSFNRLETVLSPTQTQIITLPSLKDLVVDRLLDAIYNTSADYLFFLDANETPFPDALPLLLSLAKAHPEIPWFIPNSTAIYEETQYCPNNSLDKKNINSNHFEYYTFLPFYPARFPYIFSQTPFTASGSLVKKENLLKILSTSASQELRTHTSEYFLITALALSIKPAFVCSPIVMKSRKSHLENLFHWTNFIQTHTPKEWRAKLKTYLNEENLRDYYTYPLIKALRIFGPPQSLTYKWAKRKLLSRKLKQRHSITIFISDPTKVSWNKNESFFLKSF